MENLTLDYLPNHKEITIYQHKEMFRINTDTCLLGEFLDFNKDLRVLDIGTNNGALMLYASLLNPNEIIGIDINKEALEIAKLNLDRNKVINYKLINKDVKTYIDQDKFDVIISNPPYFVSSDDLKNKNEYLKMARHEEYLTLQDLIKSVVNNLKIEGQFYLVHRYSRINDIINELSLNGLYINKEKIIYDQNKKEPISVLLKISFNKTEIEVQNFTVTR